MSRSRETAFELIGEDENILKVETMSEGYALALFRKKLQGEGKEHETKFWSCYETWTTCPW